MSLPVLREPRQETVGLYPKLVVHDGRVTGSITIGPSRLPLWAIVGAGIHQGWRGVQRGWPQVDEYGFTAADMSAFLGNLLEMRGEFGRLLLELADAERAESHHPDAAWWQVKARRKRVAAQLRRCLAALGDDELPEARGLARRGERRIERGG